MNTKLFANSRKINLIADRAWLDRIVEWRKIQDWPYPSRSEAIRRLVELALEGSEEPKS